MRILTTFTFSKKIAACFAVCLLILLGASMFTYERNFAHAPLTSRLRQLPFGARESISNIIGQDQTQYHVSTTLVGLRAENAAHALGVIFTEQGVTIKSAAAEWNIKLQGIGYGDARHAVPNALPQTRANRVEYLHGDLTEWYSNGFFGLEQGFTLNEPPSASNGAPLTLALALNGNVSARVTADQRALELLDASGTRVFSYNGLYAMDAMQRELRAWLELQNEQLLVRVDDANATYPIVIDPFVQQAKLYASEGGNDEFGEEIAMSGDTIVVGVYRDDLQTNFDERGSAYVFVKPANGWGGNLTQAAKLTASDGEVQDWFGHAVAIDGDTIVVGSRNDTGQGFTDAGAAYVFVKPIGGWSGNLHETAKLVGSEDYQRAELGSSVAIAQDTIVLGQVLDAVYVYVKPLSGWAGTLTESAVLWASDDEPIIEAFGHDVALSGETIVVSATDTVTLADDQGAAYVFVKPVAGWSGELTESAKLTSSDGAANDLFGESVAISGDTIAVSAWFDDVDGNEDEGSVYVFVKPNVGWTGNLNESAKLIMSDGAWDSSFGFDIAMSGDTIIVGNHADVIGTREQGSAYVFTKPVGGWTGNLNESSKLLACDASSSDNFGIGVAIDGATIVIGASNAPIGSNPAQGAAYVFENGVGGKPNKPTLNAPANNATTTKTRVTLKWQDVTCETEYQVFVKDTATNKNAFRVNLGGDIKKVKTSALAKGKNYKWFIKACNDFGCTKSAARTFRIQ